MPDSFTIVLDAQDAGTTVAKAVRRHHSKGLPWSRVRRLVAGGKVFVDGERVLDAAARVAEGQHLELRVTAPRPRGDSRLGGRPSVSQADLVHVDADLVVVRKPVGIASVPYEDQEPITVADRVREALRVHARKQVRPPFVVHRLDKATSGLMVLARTKRASTALRQMFREHALERSYLALCHGEPREGRYVSRLVANRGDGYRGSTERRGQGKEALTDVCVLERYASERLGLVCLVRCTLETGRTHQIRIHLAEAGHPLIGDPVYQRAVAKRGLWSPPRAGMAEAGDRLGLHSAILAFEHPRTGRELRFVEELPPDLASRVATWTPAPHPEPT